jgi:hypothetical protein
MSTSEVWPPGANHLPDLSETFYVIIGMGVGALTNRLTLPTRTNASPILHIGGPDPWAYYENLKMGQWPALLSVPGARHKPDVRSEHDFISSMDFAVAMRKEWTDLATADPFFALNEEVEAIEKAVHGYDIYCKNGSKVKAARLDVCAGPGPARLLSRSIVKDHILWKEYEDGLSSIPRTYPRLVSGERFLMRSSEALADRESVVVIGGGPTAAWCVERAEKAQCPVLWVSEDTLNSAFISSRRNDSLAEGPVTRHRMAGLHVVDSELLPSSPTTRFAEGFSAECIAISAGERLVVRFRSNSGNSRVVDSEGISPELDEKEEFAQVVVAIGQCKMADERGSWAHMLAGVLADAVEHGQHLIRLGSGRVLGLRSLNGKLRVLGSSALSHPSVREQWERASSTSNQFFHSLAEQARVDIGIAIAAATIAEANAYWTGGRDNRNLNTFAFGEFDSFWRTLPPDSDIMWQEMRSGRIPPFTTVELQSVLASLKDRY